MGISKYIELFIPDKKRMNPTNAGELTNLPFSLRLPPFFLLMRLNGMKWIIPAFLPASAVSCCWSPLFVLLS